MLTFVKKKKIRFKASQRNASVWECKKNLILLLYGHNNAYFISILRLEDTPHIVIQPRPVNLVISCKAHAVPGVVQLGGVREVQSQEIPGRAEATQQAGV